MQKSFRYPGANYPAGRPQFFALHYQRRLLREGVLVRLPPLAFAFLTKVVLEEDRRRYELPATLFNEDISAALGCSRDTLRRTRDELIAAGLLHYERPADKEAGVYWVRELEGWEPLRRTDAESEGFYRRRDAPVSAQATAPASAPVTAPPSFPKEDPNPPPPDPDPWEAVVGGLREVGVLSPAGSAEDARRNGFTPELALACVAFVLQPDNRTAIGPGAVVKRFRNPEANRWPANQNWPPVSSQAQLLRDREREARRAAEARQAADAKAAEAAAVRKRHERQLELFGPEIDRLTTDERLGLLRDEPLLVQLLQRRGHAWREDALVRQAMVAAYAAKHGSN